MQPLPDSASSWVVWGWQGATGWWGVGPARCCGCTETVGTSRVMRALPAPSCWVPLDVTPAPLLISQGGPRASLESEGATLKSLYLLWHIWLLGNFPRTHRRKAKTGPCGDTTWKSLTQTHRHKHTRAGEGERGQSKGWAGPWGGGPSGQIVGEGPPATSPCPNPCHEPADWARGP